MLALLILSYLNPLVATIIKHNNFQSIENLNKTLNDYPDYDPDYMTWPDFRSILKIRGTLDDQLQRERMQYGIRGYSPLSVPGKLQRGFSEDKVGYSIPSLPSMSLPHIYPRYYRAYMGHSNDLGPYSMSGSREYFSPTGYSYAGYIERQARRYPIMMYTLVQCIPCQRAKHLLAVRYSDVAAYFLELVGNEEWQRQLQADLLQMTGQVTFPYIFICGEHIGGSSALFQLDQSGQLRNTLNSCSRQLN